MTTFHLLLFTLSSTPLVNIMNVAGTLGVGDASQLGKMDEKTLHDSLVHPVPAVTIGDGKPTSLAEYLYWAKKQRAVEDADKT